MLQYTQIILIKSFLIMKLKNERRRGIWIKDVAFENDYYISLELIVKDEEIREIGFL